MSTTTVFLLLTSIASAVGLAGWAICARRLRARAAQLEHAEHDGLTGLWRREAFETLAPAALAAGNAIALIDLDRFKPINDTFGHAAGDQVLHAVADRLAAELGQTALLARLGGDEFAVIAELEFPAVHGQLELLVAVLTAPVSVPGVGDLAVGVSIGVAWLRDLPAFDIAGEPGPDVSRGRSRARAHRRARAQDLAPASSSAARGRSGEFWAEVLSEGLAAADAAMYAAKALHHDWRLYDRDLDPVRPAAAINPVPAQRYREHGPAALRETAAQGVTG
ncbi:GGDEF domain-containing protein [Kutzneria buriramensis]|uniref:Diguanylate cyclase (GGDEF)-like protein n=1 Tax=Kutzneria buriramensis TaxID=1045776 RepID=A0A3E0G899_9PSEU|nr:GGDEF domain-containing protein [Kutzneria buriramensis]REH18294.1 diguanylate cyclase (GGDEF)-like protein [Kutzneria buriramensis]